MTIKRWSKQEIKFLTDNYSKMTNLELAEKLDVAVDVIQRKLINLNILRHGQKKWTRDEEIFLSENYKKMKDKELAAKFNVSEISIKRKLFRLNLKRNLRALKRKKTNAETNAVSVQTPDIVKTRKPFDKNISSNISEVGIKTYNSLKTREKNTALNAHQTDHEKIIKIEKHANGGHGLEKDTSAGSSAPKVIQIVESSNGSHEKSNTAHSKAQPKSSAEHGHTPGASEKLYDPSKTYEVGDVIFHSKWEDRGKVVKTIKTAGGNRAIVVHFHKSGERTLIVGHTPAKSNE
ncbi:MAG: hypothetical protein QMC67_03050 [Candidatus Wallbacteria bacterium]